MENNRKNIIINVFSVLMIVLVFVMSVYFIVMALIPEKESRFVYGDSWNAEVLKADESIVTIEEYEEAYEETYTNDGFIAAKYTCVIDSVDEQTYISFSTSDPLEIYFEDSLIYFNCSIDKERGIDGFKMADSSCFEDFNSEYQQVNCYLPYDTDTGTISIYVYSTGYNSLAYFSMNISGYKADAAENILPSVYDILYIILIAASLLISSVVFVTTAIRRKYDYKTLLLVLFFAMLLCVAFYESRFAVISKIGSTTLMKIFLYVSNIYMTPLFFYISLHFTKWRKIFSLTASALQLISGIYFDIDLIVSGIMENWRDTGIAQAIAIMLLFAAFLSECAYQKKQGKKFIRWPNLLTFLLIAVLMLIVKSEGAVMENISSMFQTIKSGYFVDKNVFICLTLSFASIVFLLENIIRDYYMAKKANALISQKEELIIKNVQVMKTSEANAREVRHEMKHHLATIRMFLDENEPEKVYEYLDEITAKIDSTILSYTDNQLVNAIVNQYFNQAKALEIKTDCSISIPRENVGIKDFDLTVLLSNILENAVEACKRMPIEESRSISLVLNKDEDKIFFECKNTFSKSDPDKDNALETSKEDKENHGFGILAMKKIVNKYNGTITISPTENLFVVQGLVFTS